MRRESVGVRSVEDSVACPLATRATVQQVNVVGTESLVERVRVVVMAEVRQPRRLELAADVGLSRRATSS